LLVDVDEVEIGSHGEVIFCQRGLHGLPVRGGLDDLPIFFFAHAHRHRETWLIDFPTICDRAVRFVELQLQRRNRGVAEVLIENGSEVLARLLIEIRDHIFGHDVFVFEMLIEVVDEFEPARIVIHHAAQRIQK
jgi:hypothetical protein